MKNTIDAQVKFSFRGENYSPAITLDLDSITDKPETFEVLHRVIATKNQIDTYSYLYEVMESSPIIFSNAQGLAVNYLQDDNFDFSRYLKDRQDDQLSKQMTHIAEEIMGISKLENEPNLKAALIAAYKLGLNVKG